jgi:hypothetical protein
MALFRAFFSTAFYQKLFFLDCSNWHLKTTHNLQNVILTVRIWTNPVDPAWFGLEMEKLQFCSICYLDASFHKFGLDSGHLI